MEREEVSRSLILSASKTLTSLPAHTYATREESHPRIFNHSLSLSLKYLQIKIRFIRDGPTSTHFFLYFLRNLCPALSLSSHADFLSLQINFLASLVYSFCVFLFGFLYTYPNPFPCAWIFHVERESLCLISSSSSLSLEIEEAMSTDYGDKMQKCRDYIEALEEERRKIQVFKRELPLCNELMSQAIEACRQQMSGTTSEYNLGQTEYSEQTSSEGPVLEEFIPIKKSSSSDEDEEQSHKTKSSSSSIHNKDNKNNDKSSKKSDWLRSVQLWNQTPDPPIKEDPPRTVAVTEVRRNGGGAFHPFKRDKSDAAGQTGSPPTVTPAAAASSTAERGGGGGGGNKREDKEGQSQRKARRCWSPELHKRFLNALQQLGGSHVATPKQIRELMKVDGLTNDEVKSHLQKYRLHTRRPNASVHSNHPQPPQLVVVGGIWVPPPEYAAVASTTAASGEALGAATPGPGGIYAPIAAAAPPPPQPLPQPSASLTQSNQQKQLHSQESGSCHSKDRARPNSPATSSSTHTTTTSPAY